MTCLTLRSLIAASALAAVSSVEAQEVLHGAAKPTVIVQGKDGAKARQQISDAIDLLQGEDVSEKSREKALKMLQGAIKSLKLGDQVKARALRSAAKKLSDDHAGVIARIVGDESEGRLVEHYKALGDAKAAYEEAMKARKTHAGVLLELAEVEAAREAAKAAAEAKKNLVLRVDGEKIKALKAAKGAFDVLLAPDEGGSVAIAEKVRRKSGKPAAAARRVETGAGDGDIVEAINGIRAELRAIRKLMEHAHDQLDHDDDDDHSDGRRTGFLRLRAVEGEAPRVMRWGGGEAKSDAGGKVWVEIDTEAVESEGDGWIEVRPKVRKVKRAPKPEPRRVRYRWVDPKKAGKAAEAVRVEKRNAAVGIGGGAAPTPDSSSEKRKVELRYIR